ncbi:MAG: hypothetical protein DRP42_05365 [Tenericutes bacterium]|nr:MAG: hypothetical protein DRP42_05365 [Mycoplasmatota bacterium]
MQFIKNRRFGSEISKFFDKIYCINLDSRPDRWRYVNGHFTKFGLRKKVERFSAVDVRNDPELKRHEKLLQDNFSLLAMCGCLLSHRKIIEHAKQAGLDNVLVFEDDIEILESSVGSIRNCLDQLDKLDWDIFYLGATYLFSLKAVGSHLVNTPSGAYATHAIAYNSSIFDQILELLPSEPLDFLQSDRFEVNAVDKWLQSNLFDHSRFYGTNPIMVVQGLQESDIACNQRDGIAQTQIELFSRNLKY